MDTPRPSRVLVFHVGNISLAIDADHVSEITSLPLLTSMPEAPACVRGMTVWRDTTLTAVDLRVLCGLRTRAEVAQELLPVLQAREEDHIAWLKELDRCIRDGSDFTLGRDPTRCAFGLWRASYTPEDPAFAQHLSSFDEPHRAIHALAEEALDLVKGGDKAAAVALVEDSGRLTMRALRRLFREAREMLTSPSGEVVVACKHEKRLLGVIVDSVEFLQPVVEGSVAAAPPHVASSMVHFTLFTEGSDDTRLLVTLEGIAAALERSASSDGKAPQV